VRLGYVEILQESVSISATERLDRLKLGAVAIASALLYLPALSNGFVFDDQQMIVFNRSIRSWSFLWESFVRELWWFLDPNHPYSNYYRPLQDVWLGLNYKLFGLNTVGWHAALIILQSIAVCLVFAIASRIAADSWVALGAALLFAALPVHAQAVAWPSAVPIPLSAVFELGAFYLIVGRTTNLSKRALAALLYAGALLTHESAVVFPALLFLYAFLLEPSAMTELDLWTRQRIRRSVLLAAPFIVEAAAYLAVRYLILGFISRPSPVNHMTAAQELLTIPHALAIYAMLLAFPWLAGPAHRLLNVTSPLSLDVYVPLLALTGLGLVFLWAIRKHPHRRLYLFCAMWMIVAVAPVLNLRALFEQAEIQDRYLYMSSVGACVLVADLVVRMVRKSIGARRWAWAAGVMAAAFAVIVLNAATLWRVERFWHDDLSLFSRSIQEFPQAAAWHDNLGVALWHQGHLQWAEREFKRALALKADDWSALLNLGQIHAAMGRTDEGAREMAQGVRLQPNPAPDTYILLAQMYDLTGEHDKAKEMFARAAKLPGGAEAIALSEVQLKLARREDPAGSEATLRRLLPYYGDDPRIWTLLGAALAQQNRPEQALGAFQHALAADLPDPAVHFYAAQMLHRLGRDDEAMGQCKKALEVSPKYSQAQGLIGEIKAKLDRH
jgi:tetratricopeptide (TPR) repeat protein